MVSTIKERASLKLELDLGLIDGQQRYKSKTYNKIKTDAGNEDLYETAHLLASLQKNNLSTVRKVEETILTKE